ncbi:MAG: BspA family leucine-rich repeat surface protein [Fastidiosipila sp.]|nr:BspA family leucine-rich repeat surface protein [Fastidiosipila sp.]
MFEEAYSLEGIYRTNLKGVASLNTNVTDMSGMFDGRRGITELDLRYLDTSNVESMYFMFGNCNSLTSLDLSNFNTSKVTDMSFMFNFCSELTILDLSSFNTSEVRSMSYMFLRCSSLTSLNLSSLTTPSIFDMENMFEDCTSLEVLDLSTFELFELPEYNCMDNMFKNCTSLTTVFVRTEKDANFLNKTNSERINYVDKVSGKVYNKDNLSRKYSESSSDESSFSPTSNQQANPWEQPLKPPESNKQGACYIATAVYGSYDASQVLILRNFRDHTLSNSAAGRWFIRTYYKLSPPVAERLKKAKRLNRMVRSVLDKLVQHLNSKELTKRT